MIKQIPVLLFVILLAIHVDSTQINNVEPKETNIDSYDLLENAQTQLEELKEIVQGNIGTSFTELDRLANVVRNHQYTIMRGGSNMILLAYRNLNADLATLKDLANTGGKDISSCLDKNEDLLDSIQYDFLDDLAVCIPTTSGYINDLLGNSRYYVDTIINKVHDLEFQLGRCESESTLCISPIVTQIELQMVQLPQNVQTEVVKASDQFDILKVVIEDCRNPIVTDSISRGNAILAEISYCAHQILL